MASSDEEYRDDLQKYTERIIKKVGKKNPVSRSQQFEHEVQEKLKQYLQNSDESEEEYKKDKRSSSKKKEKSPTKRVEDKIPKKRGRPPKPKSSKASTSKVVESDSESDFEPQKKKRAPSTKASSSKSKSKDDVESDSESEIESPKKMRKSPAKYVKKDKAGSDAEGGSDTMFFDWSPEDNVNVKAVTRLEQHLGYGNKLVICNYKNRNSIHFRKFVEGKPTKYGITLPLTYLNKIKAAVEMAETHSRACGISLEEKKHGKSG